MDDVANFARRLFSKAWYDSVIFYHSLSRDINGKPYVEATREHIVVRGANNDSDVLYRLKVGIERVIREEMAKEGTQLHH